MASLTQSLESGVVEVRFTRRRPANGKAVTRRMFCTRCDKILLSNNGRIVLNFRPTIKSLKFIPESKGLLSVWDIIMQDYRLVPQDSVVIRYIPEDIFWETFNKEIHPMTIKDKVNFMNS